ncbi:TonB-dependent receptor plug domain-containing protein [Methylomonas sp. UP202]|uniref:TonB-dependent receptor n=1 Tax=Methylomonas sp. UP202 TaxID=3040943 RepID=UPI00247B24F5|nr:TonB-dependent receptor plug domain-containing protein [Methylomonas sp. UP202]WGS85812.1 TonB-dependent receptor plug domain-containing protein [Methylomonas sp. UP202]
MPTPAILRKTLFLALSQSLISTATIADQKPEELTGTEVIADPIIEENHVDEFSNVSAVTTEDQIRDQNAVDLASALKRTPGVQISRYNPVGAFGGDQGGAVAIRGQGAGRPGSEIKTYIDDIPMYMATWNHPLLDLLPVNGMHSITVYKGPQPHINGNNFGSINLRTKTAVEDGLHGSGRLSGGFFGTIIEQADVQGKYGDFDFSVAQGYAKSDGNRQNGYGELRNVLGKAGYQFNANWRSDVTFLYADNRAGDPGQYGVTAPIGEYDTVAGMVAASLSHQHGSWQGKFTLYHNGGDGNWLNQGVYWAGWTGAAFASAPRARSNLLSQYSMDGFRWKEQFSPWQGATLLAGIDNEWLNGKINNLIPGSDEQIYQFTTPTFRLTTPYVALSHDLVLNKEWTLVPSVGVRFYDHSHYASKVSPHAGLSLVSENLTLFGNVSNGVNYPGIDAAANSGALANVPFFSFSPQGWQGLAPESVDHAEVGLKASPFKSTQIDLSFFIDNVKNRYVFDVSQGAYLNYSTYWMRGLEASIKQELIADWSLFAGLTLLNPSIENLPYTPEQAVTAGINGPIGPLRFSFDLQYQSRTWALNRSRNISDVNTQRVEAFTVANTRLALPISELGKKGEVFVSVENLFDKRYVYRPGYEMPGIWGQVGIAASF